MLCEAEFESSTEIGRKQTVRLCPRSTQRGHYVVQNVTMADEEKFVGKSG